MARRIFRPVFPMLVALLVLTPLVSALDEVTYRAALEKDRIKFGEKVQFLILVNFGPKTMSPSISAPSFAQFNVLNENEKIEETGQGEEKYKILKHVWLLEPTETGRLSIASGIVTYQDPTSNLLQNGKTDVVFLQVDPSEEYLAAHKNPEKSAPGPTPPAAGQGKSIYLFGLAALAGLLLAGLLALIRKPKAATTAVEAEALETLHAAIAHAEAGNLEEYYAAITRTLLDYLQKKFGLDAHVLSTPVLLEKIAAYGLPAPHLRGLEDFFKIADKAKFAGYVPDEDKMIELHGSIQKFIEAGRKLKIKQPKPVRKKTEEDD